MYVNEHDLLCKVVMRDNDKKHPKTFEAVFTMSTCNIKRNVPAAPNLLVHAE